VSPCPARAGAAPTAAAPDDILRCPLLRGRYAAYSAWAKAGGERQPLTKKGFAHRLEWHGFAAANGAKGVRIRRGIRLREQHRLSMTAAENADGDPFDGLAPVDRMRLALDPVTLRSAPTEHSGARSSDLTTSGGQRAREGEGD